MVSENVIGLNLDVDTRNLYKTATPDTVYVSTDRQDYVFKVINKDKVQLIYFEFRFHLWDGTIFIGLD